MNVVMAVEGVIFEGLDIRTAPPSQHGRSLYEALKGLYQVSFLSISPAALVQQRLAALDIRGYATINHYDSNGLGLDVPLWKAYVVRGMLASSSPVAWFVDTDPDSVRQVFLEGVPTLLVSHPRYTRPEFRPGGEKVVRPWADLTSTIELEEQLHAGGSHGTTEAEGGGG